MPKYVSTVAVIAFLLTLFVVLPLSVTTTFAQDASLTETLSDDDQFSTLVTLLQATPLGDTLAEGDYTVFAPTDEAFAELPPFVVDYLTANPDLLTDVLGYHVVEGAVPSADVFAAQTLDTLAGEPLNVDAALSTVNGAEIVTPDLEAANGVIHAIDTVLIPTLELPPVDPFVSFDDIAIAGSSTVRPVTERIDTLFEREGFSGTITLQETGTSAGLERFCVNAELDVANASRPIEAEEVEACEANDINPVEFLIGIDALAVAVSVENTFVDNLTFDQLAQIFSGEALTWDEINPEWPPEPISTFSPGADSGTFDYFVEEIFDEDASRLLDAQNVGFSESDDVLVSQVGEDPYAIGYFGYAYYSENQDTLRVVNIDGVEPNEATAESGEYPLSRPLFIYTGLNILQEKPQVAEYVKFYITNVADQLGTEPEQIAYFPTSANVANLNRLLWLAAGAGGA